MDTPEWAAGLPEADDLVLLEHTPTALAADAYAEDTDRHDGNDADVPRKAPEIQA